MVLDALGPDGKVAASSNMWIQRNCRMWRPPGRQLLRDLRTLHPSWARTLEVNRDDPERAHGR
jgi:hypothetical protein